MAAIELRAPRAMLLIAALAVACDRAHGSQSAPLAPKEAHASPAPKDSSHKPAAHATPTKALAGADRRIKLRGGGARAVRGEHGVVTSVEPQATRAGIAMLEQGGNAVDAAVAVAYALAVTHPSAGNIGGGGFMLVANPGAAPVAIDFRETAPSGLTRHKFGAMIANKARGAAAVGIPGSVAGLNLAHRRFGKLPLRVVLEPAIALARSGFLLGLRQAQSIAWSWADLRADPAARQIFGRGERPAGPGRKLKNPDLATVLERIARDGDIGFYEGPTARRLLAAVAPAGMMTASDLESYRAVIREPLVFSYRGLAVHTMPPPSAGGVALTQTLLMLEQHAAHELPAGSADALHLFVEASRRAHAERRFSVVDPDALDASAVARKRRRWLDPSALLTDHPIDRAHATPSAKVHPLYPAAVAELEHTTHLSVVDRDGRAVSCTVTLSAGFGAKMVAPGTGIVLNNSVAAFATAGENRPTPGRRTTSSMAPTLALDGSRTRLVLGTPGGDTIPSTIVQVLRNVVDYDMTIDDAIDAPRVHHGFVPDRVRYERDRPPPKPVLITLGRLGHQLVGDRRTIGDANDVLIDEHGVAWAYADPREGGLALAASR